MPPGNEASDLYPYFGLWLNGVVVYYRDIFAIGTSVGVTYCNFGKIEEFPLCCDIICLWSSL